MEKSGLIKFFDQWGVIVGFVIAKLTVHLVVPAYGFHRDEFLYLVQGDHLAWGYMVVPPGIALVGKLTNLLLGDSLLAVRSVPALAGGATILFTGLMVREMGGKHFAQFVACLALFSSIAFLRINSLFQPVSFNVLFWVVLAYSSLRYVNTKNPNYILGMGVILGLALLTKYSVLVFALGITLGLFVSENRLILKTRYPYLAVAIALLIWSPNVVWQWQNGFPLINHMVELSRHQLSHVSPMDFVGDQFLYNANSILIWLSGVYFLGLTAMGRKYRHLFWAFLVVIAVLLTLSGKSYYSMGAYPMLMAAGAIMWEHWTQAKKWVWVRVLIPLLIFLGSLPILPLTLPIYPIPRLVEYGNRLKTEYGFDGPFTWEDDTVHDLPQDWADMLGWDELVEKIARAYEGLTPEEQARTIIFADNYGQAGAISYLGRKYGLPEAISFNASFLYWSPETLDADIAIFAISDSRPAELFRTVSKVGEITTEHSREKGLPIFLCQNPGPYLRQAYEAERSARLNGR